MSGLPSSLPACGAARADELPALDALWRAAFDAPPSRRAAWSRRLQLVRVARVAGVPRGACVLSPLRLAVPRGLVRLVWLRSLVVEPPWRGRGIATALIAHARAIASRNNASLALRSAERDLYQRAGLHVAGEVRGLLLPRSGLQELRLHPLVGVTARDARALAAACALAAGGAVPLPGPRLSALLADRGLRLAAADGAACGLMAREGTPWCAAGDARSAAAWLACCAAQADSELLRVDSWLPGGDALPQAVPRPLGPWWTDTALFRGDLPASVLSCLD